MNDSILTTLVLSLTLVAVLSVLFDFIMYARSEKVVHIFKTQTIKDIKESFPTSGSISLIIDVVLLVFWVLTQGVVARVADSFLVLSGIDKLILVVIQIMFAIATLVPVVTYILTDISRSMSNGMKKLQKEAEEHQNPI